MSNATPQTTQKQEAQAPEGAEFTRTRRVFMPRADIFETPENIVVLAEMPGADEKNIDITLEKNVLTITGRVEAPSVPDGLRLAYEEYEVGDYQRAFTLSNEIDREHIEATIKHGVLKVTLPKMSQARTRKISVKGE